MKTKGNYIIKTSAGGYWCGSAHFDPQIRKAQIYHWKEAAEEMIETLRRRKYITDQSITLEVLEVIPPREKRDTEAHWKVSGAFDDFLQCSNCGESWPWATAADFLFCPHCGKLMIEEKHDEM